MSRTGACCLAVVVLYLLCVWLAAAYSPLAGGFSQSGPGLLVYHGARFLLAFYFLAMLAAAGALVLRSLRLEEPLLLHGSRSYLICCGFLGASTLGIVMILLGMLEAYGFWLALALTVPLVAVSPWLLARPLAAMWRSSARLLKRASPLERAAVLLLAMLVAMTALLILLGKGLAPEMNDGDVWEHYLHYYHTVLTRGGIWPNDVWYHFYLSKGAGLFFLSMLLTDVLAAPLVSWCLLMLTALVVYDIVRRRTSSSAWALLSALLFLLFMALDSPIVASFSKHHIAVMAYLILGCWAVMRLLSAPRGAPQRPIALVTGVAFFYIAFYEPIAAALMLAGCGGAWLVQLAFFGRRALRLVVPLLVASLLGGLTAALSFNYAVTGMAEMVPTRLMWDLADQPRFDALWGRSVIEFFLMEQPPTGCRPMTLSRFLTFDVNWCADLCRFSYFKRFATEATPVILALALSVYIFTGRSLLKELVRVRLLLLRRLAPLLGAGGFLLGLLVLSQGFRDQPSLLRMYSFTAPFIIIVLVMLWSALLCASPPGKTLLGTIVVVSVVLQPAKTLYKVFPHEGIAYATGSSSARDAFAAVSKRFNRESQFGDYLAVSQLLSPGERLCRLTYDTSSGYFLPGRPVVSEPTYAFQGDYAEMIFGSADRAEALLRAQHVTHFSIDLRYPLFVALPFSELFSPDRLNERFSLAWRKGDLYVLTWRDRGGDVRDLPRRLVEVFEMKRNNTLAYVDSEEFSQDVLATLCDHGAWKRHWLQIGGTEPCINQESVARAVCTLLEENLGERLASEENREFQHSLLELIQDEIRFEVELTKVCQDTSPRQSGSETQTRQLAERIVSRVRGSLREACDARWGPEVSCSIRQSGWHFGGLYRKMHSAHLAAQDLPDQEDAVAGGAGSSKTSNGGEEPRTAGAEAQQRR